jgi:hypothetical protein
MSNYLTGGEIVGRSDDGYTYWVGMYLHDAKPMSKEDIYHRRTEGERMHWWSVKPIEPFDIERSDRELAAALKDACGKVAYDVISRSEK